MTLPNRAFFTVSNTPGTAGNFVVSAAVAGPYRTLGAAQDGLSMSVSITEGSAWEVRTGCTYTHSTTTLTRGTLEESSTGSAIDFTSAAQVMVVGLAGLQIESVLQPCYVDTYPGADLGAKFNAAIAHRGKQFVHFVVRGQHTHSTCVDFTDSWGCVVDLKSAGILCTAHNTYGFDFTDSGDLSVEWSWVVGDSTLRPLAYFLCGAQNTISLAQPPEYDVGTGEAVERNRFRGGTISGYWQYAAVIYQGREVAQFTGTLTNCSSTGYVLALTKNGYLLLNKNDFTEQTAIVSPIKGDLTVGFGSITKFRARDLNLWRREPGGLPGVGLLYLQGPCNDSVFDGLEFRSNEEPCILVADDTSRAPVFRNVNARLGAQAGVRLGAASTFDLIKLATLVATMNGLRLSGGALLRDDSKTGTAGYLVRMFPGGNGFVKDWEFDVQVATDGDAKGIDLQERSISRLIMPQYKLESGAFINIAGAEILFAGMNKSDAGTSAVRIANTNITVKGKNAAVINVSGASTAQGIETTTAGHDAVVEDISVTNSVRGGVLLQGNRGRLRNITVSSASRDGFLVRSNQNVLENCRVVSVGASYYALAFDATNATQTASNNLIAGGEFVGNVRFETNAVGGEQAASHNMLRGVRIVGNVVFQSGCTNNCIEGEIVGDVTFDAGAVNCRVIGRVSGAVTNNGTGCSATFT